MSTQASSILLELAGKNLLWDKSLVILALEDLPTELLPPLIMDALATGHTEVLKKMVLAWPFTCFPLWALMKEPCPETIGVVLDGLNMMHAQKIHLRKDKLQMLYLWNVSQNFWSVWSGVLA